MVDEDKVDSLVDMAVGEVIDKLAPVQVKIFFSEKECNKWLNDNMGKVFIEHVEYSSLPATEMEMFEHRFAIWYNTSPQLSRENLTSEIRDVLKKIIDDTVDNINVKS